jgi:Na+-driven multidrug efflux pump
MGIFKPTGTSTVYVQEYSWKRSPEVWKTFAQLIAIAFIFGLVFGAIKLGNVDSKAKPTPAVTVTVTQTILPKIRR